MRDLCQTLVRFLTRVQLRKISHEAGHTNSQLCLNLDEGGRIDNRIAENGYMGAKINTIKM